MSLIFSSGRRPILSIRYSNHFMVILLGKISIVRNLKYIKVNLLGKLPHSKVSIIKPDHYRLLGFEKIEFWSLNSLFLNRDHSSITSSKRWVGRVRKWQFSMIYSTVNHQRSGWVGLTKLKT